MTNSFRGILNLGREKERDNSLEEKKKKRPRATIVNCRCIDSYSCTGTSSLFFFLSFFLLSPFFDVLHPGPFSYSFTCNQVASGLAWDAVWRRRVRTYIPTQLSAYHRAVFHSFFSRLPQFFSNNRKSIRMGFFLSRLTFDAIDEYGRYLARVSAGWVEGGSTSYSSLRTNCKCIEMYYRELVSVTEE